MPHYMTQFTYTSDAWAALAKNPQNREEVLRALVENRRAIAEFLLFLW